MRHVYIIIEQDSKDCDDAEINIFVEDHRFLKLMRAGISQENGVNLHHAFTF